MAETPTSAWSAAGSPAHKKGVAFFEAKIRPLIIDHCQKCHDGSAGKSKGGNPSDNIQVAKDVVSQFRTAFRALNKAGSMQSSKSGIGDRVGATIYQNVPGVERLTNPKAYSARQDIERLRTQGISSLVPILTGMTLGGRNFDAAKELELWRNSIASITDYDSAVRAMNVIDKRISQIEAQPTAGKPGNVTPRRTSPAPAASGWGKATVRGN